MNITGGKWLEGVSHKQTQTCIAFVDIDINIPKTLKHNKPLDFGSPKLQPPRAVA